MNFMQKRAYRLGVLCLCLLLFAFLAPQQAYAQKIGKGATSDQVFEILASEIALQRGEAGLAYQTYLGLARQTGQADLAQRAMEIAIAANAAPSPAPVPAERQVPRRHQSVSRQSKRV